MTLKQVSIALFQENVVPKIMYFLNAMKFDTQNMLIMNIVLAVDGLDPKLWIRVNLVATLKFAPIFMKFGTHNKSNMLIVNIIHTSV